MSRSCQRDEGQRGEDFAAAMLQEQGFVLLARNWRDRFGEVDLVVRRDELLLFVEVKARSGPGWDRGAASVTPRKQQRITHAARSWLGRHGTGRDYIRFDVIEVDLQPSGPVLAAWIEGAFEARE